MKRPLGTSAARMESAPFVLVDLQTEEGVGGRAHVFCYLGLAAPLIRQVIETAGELIAGAAVDPQAIARRCNSHFTLLGTQGVVGMALSALDVACWDALSRAADQPLGRYLGGVRETVPAYNSNGLSLNSPDELTGEAHALLAEGFEALKIRLGRDAAGEDLRAIEAVRSAMSPGSPLMADYNQALGLEEAIRRAAALDEAGLYWIEEPLRHDDFAGSAELAEVLQTPVQAGENFCGPNVLAAAMERRAMDCVMFDLMRIGGVSGWLQAAELAERAKLPVSSHLYPEVSIHLLAATPAAHWLEYVDWAEPFLATEISVLAGHAQVPLTSGTGVTWDEAAVRRFAID